MSTLEEKVKALPPELQQEVERFMDSLLRKRGKKETRKMNLSWRGGLKDLKDKYTSVELQHQILEWWEED
ncbi:MAG: DUF2281 domain-containing protein [Calditrichaeota bacterium]|nr:DUF2281 domain-containing protein [Calditrichota bacterium]